MRMAWAPPSRSTAPIHELWMCRLPRRGGAGALCAARRSGQGHVGRRRSAHAACQVYQGRRPSPRGGQTAGRGPAPYQRGGCGAGVQRTDDLIAIKTWHAHVNDSEVGLLCDTAGKAFGAVEGGADLEVAEVLQGGDHDLVEKWVVVYDEHSVPAHSLVLLRHGL